MTSLFFCK